MDYKYSATYEFENDQPETIRGVTIANQHHLAFRDVAKLLRKSFKGRKPSSIVIVLEINPSFV